MYWQAEFITLLRVLLDDLVSPQLYTDKRLTQVIAVAAQLVTSELRFANNFKVDIQALTIEPSPVDRATTRDDNFINLVTIKSACLIERGETRRAVGQGISIRDGSSSIDLRGTMDGRMKLLEKGWCSVYEEVKLEYQTARVGLVAGAAIMSPFRIFAGSRDQVYYTSNEGRTFFPR